MLTTEQYFAALHAPSTEQRLWEADFSNQIIASLTGCAGPCHGLSANAAWAPPCANCPHFKELSRG